MFHFNFALAVFVNVANLTFFFVLLIYVSVFFYNVPEAKLFHHSSTSVSMSIFIFISVFISIFISIFVFLFQLATKLMELCGKGLVIDVGSYMEIKCQSASEMDCKKYSIKKLWRILCMIVNKGEYISKPHNLFFSEIAFIAGFHRYDHSLWCLKISDKLKHQKCVKNVVYQNIQHSKVIQ